MLLSQDYFPTSVVRADVFSKSVLFVSAHIFPECFFLLTKYGIQTADRKQHKIGNIVALLLLTRTLKI